MISGVVEVNLRSGVFIVNFEHSLDLVLVFVLLTLNMQLEARLHFIATVSLRLCPPKNQDFLFSNDDFLQ